MKLPARLQWHRLAPREQMIALLTVAVLIGVGDFMLHDWQQKKLLVLNGRLNDVKNEIRGVKADVLLRQNEIDQASARQVEAKARASLAAQTQEQLSQRGKLSALVAELMRIAKEENIQVVSIKPGEPQDQGGYVELSMTLDIRGQFRNLGEYLHQVQHLQHMVLVGRVHMELQTVEQSMLTVQVETVSFMGKA